MLGGAVLWPSAARAKQSVMALVGLLSSAQLDDRQVRAIRQGLKEAGYIEGRNLAIKYRSADSRFDRLPALAADLVSDRVDAIVALSPSAAVAAKAATTTIPIVFATGADPVDLGLVSSLNRPGGNVTGVTFIVNTLGAKRLGVLRELVPSANVIGLLTNPGNPTSESQIRDVQTAAHASGIEPVILPAGCERNIEAATRRAGGASCDARNLLFARVCRHWWTGELWAQPNGSLSPCWRLRRADSHRREACRSTSHAVDHVRVRHQSQDRKGARSRRAADDAGRG
jgi:ABC-type uncharacterized transport system substrate-binding protein